MGNQRFRPYGLYRFIAFLFGLTKFKSIDFLDEHFELNFKNGSNSIKYVHVMEMKYGGIFFKKFQLTCYGNKYTFRGLSRRDCSRLVRYFEVAEKNGWEIKLKRHEEILESVSTWVEEVKSRTNYQRASVFKSYVSKARDLEADIPGKIPKSVSEQKAAKELDKVRNFLKNLHQERETNNREYIPLEIERQKKLFDEIESNPLTEEQRKAVVIDEDSNLVVAAAGSGKTSVIVAKAAWLIEKGLRKPNEILLLAFGANAKSEMSERLLEKVNSTDADQFNVNTFHSLGKYILEKCSKKKITISDLASDRDENNKNRVLAKFVKETLSEKAKEPEYRKLITRWFSSFFAPYESEFDFENYGQYWNYIKSQNIRSLKSIIYSIKQERVKSYEECEIANFLYLQGINYEYEKPYEHDTATETRRQYQPDFYLTDYGIYIEHLGLKGFGRTAPFVDRKEYLKSLRWKRNIHKQFGTTLVETYSCEKSQNILTERLKEKLVDLGVVFKELDSKQTLELLNEGWQIDSLTQKIITFLGHFKGSQLSEADIRSMASKLKDSPRNMAFLDLFMPIFEAYQEKLKLDKAIDFHDMISKATDLVNDGKFLSPFSYIMIDEFQDISVGRAKLIRALQKSNPNLQLFCVGDDWQAIFRFTGSDINIMKNFEGNFGTYVRSDLSTTFRCEQKISDEATNFILKNEFQISKSVQSIKKNQDSSVYICLREQTHTNLPLQKRKQQKTQFLNDQLLEILNLISEQEQNCNQDNKPDILILGRYNDDVLQSFTSIDYRYLFKKLQQNFSNFILNYKTAHGSKGLEADYILILDDGFPSEQVDDPLINMVLSEPEAFPNAEERRLFYVALTRAKKKVFLLCESGNRSVFFDEVIQSEYDFEVLGKPIPEEHKCSRCKEGKLRLKSGENFDPFWSCSNFPYCEFKVQTCPLCKQGFPKRIFEDEQERIQCDTCEQIIESCPVKGCSGLLRQRKNNNDGSYFLACTEYYNREKPCSYTRDLNFRDDDNALKLRNKIDTPKNFPTFKNASKSVKNNFQKSQRNFPKSIPEKNDPDQKGYSVKAIRKENPNAYKAWTKKEEKELAALVLLGKKDSEIAKKLDRQEGAIRSRKKKLNL